MKNTVKYSPATHQFIAVPSDAFDLSNDVVAQAEQAMSKGLPFVILSSDKITVSPDGNSQYYADKGKWLNYTYKYSQSVGGFYPRDMPQSAIPEDAIDITDGVHMQALEALNAGKPFLIGADGDTINVAPSVAHVWDAKKGDWVLDKTKQAELDKQVLDAADAQLTCLMSQMCAWLTIESYKPKADQLGGNILSPVKIDEMLQGLPSSVETDLMRNAWSRATRIEFTSATTQSFAQILGMSKDQLRTAMTEAKAL